MNNILVTIILAIIMLVLDGIWIGTIRGDFYSNEIQRIQGNKMQVKPLGAILAYSLMLISIIFISIPLVESKLTHHSPQQIWGLSFLYGGLLGLCLYGVYNGTNYATLKRYSREYVITDTLWGIFIIGLLTGIGVYLKQK